MSPSSSRRAAAVPLLLDAFPLPPSHIPLTPQSATFSSSHNPPPSKPPSSPLPPVPGPSRISEADTLQLLLQSSRGLRRSSRYSLNSEANRDSVISTTSSSGYAFPRPLGTPSSPRGTTTTSSSSSAIRDVVSPMLPIFDDDEDDDDDEPLPPPPLHATAASPTRRRKRHQANESISSIDVRDILGAVSAGEEEEPPKPILTSHSHKSSLAYLKFDDEPLPASTSTITTTMEPSTTTTITTTTPSHIRSSSSSSSATSTKLYPIGIKETIANDQLRAPSPDIDTIIQTTPKPTKRSFSMSSSASRSRATSLRSVRSLKNVREEDVDEFGALAGAAAASVSPTRLSKTTHGRKPRDLEFVARGSWNSPAEEESEEKLQALEKELEGGDSDSDIDLHTPLPHLMVRDGLLSSNSKLFADSRANTPIASGRPSSSLSTVTKSGVIKDERDTPSRRVRHRDGRLLRGGIGLTTGLGWSDSEDEDAPSPLTRRLSTLNLSRRSSASSFFSSSASSSSRAAHPLSRSYSSGTLYEDSGFHLGGPPMESDEDLLKDVAGRGPTSNPPTSWSKKRNMGTNSARSSMASSTGRQSIASSNGRFSVGSHGSVEVTSPTDATTAHLRTPSRPRGSVSSGESIQNRRSGDSFYSRSTASTVSIPLPVTPQHDSRVPNHVNKNKSLPPLPGVLKHTPSKSSLRASQLAFPRTRTTSTTTTTTSATPTTPVRPLRLPGQVRAAAAATRGDRPAVPVPSLRSTQSQGEMMVPTSPTTSPTPTPKPRPRIGNGMVYKRSVSASTKVPRPPMSSNSMSTSAIGRPSGLPRAL